MSDQLEPKKIKVKIREQSFVARLAALKLKSKSVAIVFGSTIHLWNVSRHDFLQNESWVLHELQHIKQYRRLGFLSFILQYVWESMKHGYHRNCFEVEARAAEKEKTPEHSFIIE